MVGKLCPGLMIFRWNSQPQPQTLKITEPLRPDADFRIDGWKSGWHKYRFNEHGEVISWIRFDARQVIGRRRTAGPYLSVQITQNQTEGLQAQKFWLAQANHLFAQLQATSHLEDYGTRYRNLHRDLKRTVLVDKIAFILTCLPNPHNIHKPEGYLFVCPPQDFKIGAEFRWPDYPAFWSLNPSGSDPLSTEDATILGFPMIHLKTRVRGLSWGQSVYDGLRQIHRAKGFDPESQEVAIHLNYPLYELSCEALALAAAKLTLCCGTYAAFCSSSDSVCDSPAFCLRQSQAMIQQDSGNFSTMLRHSNRSSAAVLLLFATTPILLCTTGHEASVTLFLPVPKRFSPHTLQPKCFW
ncbi:hypothetical protein B0H14DRAFT_2585128 [Mycena olivaceomarginata]|nr:hypothetical protein B0H14DRAFT_2585128 [Mycena olivaceomarginata]